MAANIEQSAKQAKDNAEIEVLVISPLQDIAELIQTQLRGAGKNVHVTWLVKPENMADELQRQPPRVICCHEDSSPEDMNRLIGLCVNIARGIPVIAVIPKQSPTRAAELLQTGAAQVVSPKNLALMTRAIERELDAVNLNDKLKESRQHVSTLRRQLGSIVAESPEGLAYVHDGIHTHLNLAYAKLFGFEDPAELEGVPLMDLVTPESRKQIKKLLSNVRKATAKSEPESDEFVAQRADDSKITLNMRCRAASLEGEEQVEILVTRDTPTVGAPPANAFESRLMLYRTLSDVKALGLKDRSVGIVFICIDDLEKLQDRMGLLATDQIMSEVSLFLLENLKEEDQSFRFDVGEFVLLVAGETSDDIRAAAEKIRAAMQIEVFGDEEVSSTLTASLAVAYLTEDDANSEHLLKALRMARKTSVRDGNTVVIAASEDRVLSDREADHAWLTRIKTSLEQDTFTLAYQSIASLEGDSSHHYDIQLRMIGEKGEAIRPGEFLPTASRHSLMPAIDQWVVRQVLDVMRTQQSRNDHTLMFVKLSKNSIETSDVFVPWLKVMIEEFQVKTDDLAFAFDEETLQLNTHKATALAKALKELGIKLAIHGFGSSSNSLQLLDLFSADYIRLDPLFTQALVSPEHDKRLNDTMQAAQSKKIKIIASQVEDANSMARLWQSGVNYIQGYFVQEPGNTAQKSDLHVA